MLKKILSCDNNKLTKLPALPECKGLYCRDNQLTRLPALPKFTFLRCDNNKLTQLPALPNCGDLSCDNNKLTQKPAIPNCVIEWTGNPGNHPDIFGNQIVNPVIGDDGVKYDQASLNYYFSKDRDGRYKFIHYIYNEHGKSVPNYVIVAGNKPLTKYKILGQRGQQVGQWF